MSDSLHKDHSEDRDQTIEQQTGGFAGQAGYNNRFVDGVYQNPDVADAGQSEDRAGSHEDGYGSANPGDALHALPPRDGPEIGGNTPRNNYTEGRELDQAGKPVVEE